MSGEHAPNDAVQPDEQTGLAINMALAVALLGGGPAPDSSPTDVAGSVVEQRAGEAARSGRPLGSARVRQAV